MLWAVSAAALLSGCGYIGEPMYPLLNIPARVENLTAVQRGSAIIFQFDLPKLTTEGKQAKIAQTEIRVGAASGNLDEWFARSVSVEAAADQGGHVRSEMPALPWVGKEILLGVKVFGPNHRDAGWSNLAVVTVVPPLPKPGNIKAEAVAQGVRVTWRGAAGPYKVFRQAEGEKDYAPAATVETAEWLDGATEYGKQYRYIVQATQKAGDSEAQSDLSDAAEVTPVDMFPPSVPGGLNAIAAVDHIELVWERNTEPDMAGYRLYRGPAEGAMEKIADIAEAPSYSDRTLESGKRYRYAVSAVDRSGNESKQSETVEITAP
jgi:hypothetical protein